MAQAGHAPFEQDTHRIAAQVVGLEFSFREVLFGEGTDRRSLAWCDSLERIAVRVAGSELDLHEDEGISSIVQTLAAPKMVFRAPLRQDGARQLELARA